MALHAHIHFESRDCDGQYEHDRDEGMTAEEKASDFGDLEFKRRMAETIMSIVAENGTLTVREGYVEWRESTEEGYRYAIAEWCGEEPEGRNC